MDSGELLVLVLDPAGNELGRHVAMHPDRLRAGQELWLSLGGRETLVRVLGERSGAGGERTARVIEIHLRCPCCAGSLLAVGGRAAVQEDDDGHFVPCPHCGRRVAIERIPSTPPGGPVRLRVAPDQLRH